MTRTETLVSSVDFFLYVLIFLLFDCNYASECHFVVFSAVFKSTIINCYLWRLEALPPTLTGALPMDPAGDPLGPLFYFPLTKSWLRPPCLQRSRKRVQQLKKT